MTMSDVSESELISAYLDGELTAEEQVRAEQILAASAEARQLLQQLPGLRAGGQDLFGADLLFGGQFAVEIRANQFAFGNVAHSHLSFPRSAWERSLSVSFLRSA